MEILMLQKMIKERIIMKEYLNSIKKRSFEENLKELENISRIIENDEIPLNEILDMYQKATILGNYLNNYLEEIKGKIEIFKTKVDNGEEIFEPFFKEQDETIKDKTSKSSKKNQTQKKEEEEGGLF